VIAFLDGMTPIFVVIACLFAAQLFRRPFDRYILMSPGAEAVVFFYLMVSMGLAIYIGRMHLIPRWFG
jgi:hypothetical protein